MGTPNTHRRSAGHNPTSDCSNGSSNGKSKTQRTTALTSNGNGNGNSNSNSNGHHGTRVFPDTSSPSHAYHHHHHHNTNKNNHNHHLSSKSHKASRWTTQRICFVGLMLAIYMAAATNLSVMLQVFRTQQELQQRDEYNLNDGMKFTDNAYIAIRMSQERQEQPPMVLPPEFHTFDTGQRYVVCPTSSTNGGDSTDPKPPSTLARIEIPPAASPGDKGAVSTCIPKPVGSSHPDVSPTLIRSHRWRITEGATSGGPGAPGEIIFDYTFANYSDIVQSTKFDEHPEDKSHRLRREDFPKVYNAALCRVRPSMTEKLLHFAHAMEEIYKCFDYWVEHANIAGTNDPTTKSAAGGTAVVPVLLYDRKTQQEPLINRAMGSNPFMNGIKDFLTTQIGLMIAPADLYWDCHKRHSEERESKDDAGGDDKWCEAIYHPDQTIRTYRTHFDGYLMQHPGEWNSLMDRHMEEWERNPSPMSKNGGNSKNPKANAKKQAKQAKHAKQLGVPGRKRKGEESWKYLKELREKLEKERGIPQKRTKRQERKQKGQSMTAASIPVAAKRRRLTATEADVEQSEREQDASDGHKVKEVGDEDAAKEADVDKDNDNDNDGNVEDNGDANGNKVKEDPEQGKLKNDTNNDVGKVKENGNGDGTDNATDDDQNKARDNVKVRDEAQEKKGNDGGGNANGWSQDDTNDVCLRPPRIGILNRRGARRIQNAADVAEKLSQMVYVYGKSGSDSASGNQPNDDSVTRLRKQSIPVEEEYFEGKTFEEQVAFFRRMDIVISGHGAQLTGMVFMNSKSGCKQLLEFFPKNYAPIPYFGSLAIQSGLRHSYVYFDDGLPDASEEEDPSGEDRMDFGLPLRNIMPWERVMPVEKKIRYKSRQALFCPRMDAMISYAAELVMDWYQCHGC